MSLLTFHNLSQSFGAVDIFAGLTGSIAHGTKTGLVGPNGIGKTTLLHILAGLEKQKGGHIHLARGTAVGYLHQEAMRAFSDETHTIYDEMLTVFTAIRKMEAELHKMEAAMSNGGYTPNLLTKYGEKQEQFEQAGGYSYDLLIQQTLTGLGFPPDLWQMPIQHASGGQKTRALLARLLLEQPHILILDEPTNHLDMDALEWLENKLRSWQGTLLIVSHDRYFLDKVINTTWEMSRNGLESYKGNYSAYLIQREERWTRRDEEFLAIKARFHKKVEYVKRCIQRDSSTDHAKGILRRLIREVKAVEVGGVQALQVNWSKFMDETGISGEKWSVADVERHIRSLQHPNPRLHHPHMAIKAGHRSGNIVMRTKDLIVGYPDNPLFMADDIELLRRECAALIGPNGTGKSTFLRVLLGELMPLNGRFQLGASLQPSYFAQAHETLDPANNVLEELLTYKNIPIGRARNYLAQYLFRGDDVFKPVAALSGGERGRLALAKMALGDGNFLMLDEPTNHLDITSQEVLQKALETYEGTVLLVSHDRYLIDRLATQIWELRDGRLHVFHGSYQAYQAHCKDTVMRQPVA
ncbi:MAG: ABC-F family ATP-binding cassette domain-containing protein [Chloroflexi bacterium]|nr:ABC-F family ATP-binding cassette domain-containing protein [Chloroflexota bacterium]